jgi:hypothetical protein
MKIKVKDLLIKSSKSSFFKRGTDIFFINKRFIKKTKKGTFFEFPEWATQIYVKHNNEMYKIFLNDFRNFILIISLFHLRIIFLNLNKANLLKRK